MALEPMLLAVHHDTSAFDDDAYEVAKHPKANSSGVKSERPNLRSVPRRAFRKLDDVEQRVLALFGTTTSP